MCPICFWQRGLDTSRVATRVAIFRRGKLMPLCVKHLETMVEIDLPVRAIVPASDVLDALLDVYQVDALEPADQPQPTLHS